MDGLGVRLRSRSRTRMPFPEILAAKDRNDRVPVAPQVVLRAAAQEPPPRI